MALTARPCVQNRCIGYDPSVVAVHPPVDVAAAEPPQPLEARYPPHAFQGPENGPSVISDPVPMPHLQTFPTGEGVEVFVEMLVDDPVNHGYHSRFVPAFGILCTVICG